MTPNKSSICLFWNIRISISLIIRARVLGLQPARACACERMRREKQSKGRGKIYWMLCADWVVGGKTGNVKTHPTPIGTCSVAEMCVLRSVVVYTQSVDHNRHKCTQSQGTTAMEWSRVVQNYKHMPACGACAGDDPALRRSALSACFVPSILWSMFYVYPSFTCTARIGILHSVVLRIPPVTVVFHCISNLWLREKQLTSQVLRYRLA